MWVAPRNNLVNEPIDNRDFNIQTLANSRAPLGARLADSTSYDATHSSHRPRGLASAAPLRRVATRRARTRGSRWSGSPREGRDQWSVLAWSPPPVESRENGVRGQRDLPSARGTAE